MKTIRIPRGNRFDIYIPIEWMDGGRVQAEELSNLQVVLKRSNHSETIPASIEITDSRFVVHPDDILPLGSYDITITAINGGNAVCLPLNNCFAVCEWANGANYADDVVCEKQVLVGVAVSDAELEALKAQYRAAIASAQAAEAAAEAARAEYDRKAEALDGVATEQTSQEILTAVENIDFDTTELAKVGTNVNATNTAILAAVSDNAALNTEVASAKQALVTAINGQGGDSSTSESLTELAQDVADLTVQRLDLQGYSFGEPEPTTIAEVLELGKTNVVAIDDYTTVHITGFARNNILQSVIYRVAETIVGSAFSGSTALEYAEFPRLIRSTSNNSIFEGCTSLKTLLMPNVTAFSVYHLCNNCTLLEFVDMSELATTIGGVAAVFTNAVNLIDVCIGKNLTTSFYILDSWNPTNVLADATKTATLNANIRNHIAAKVQDRTGQSALTITFSQALRNALETATEQAFAAKNWNISPARTN